jgi:hypothetical protein
LIDSAPHRRDQAGVVQLDFCASRIRVVAARASGSSARSAAPARRAEKPPRAATRPARAQGIPDALAELVLQLLAKRPEDRPASAGEVAAKLREIEGALG